MLILLAYYNICSIYIDMITKLVMSRNTFIEINLGYENKVLASNHISCIIVIGFFSKLLLRNLFT